MVRVTLALKQGCIMRTIGFATAQRLKKEKKKKKKTEKNVILVSTTRRSDEIVFVLWPLVTLCEAKENVNNMNFGHHLGLERRRKCGNFFLATEYSPRTRKEFQE